MTTTATYPATMADLRGHPTHSSMWSNYGGSVHMPGRVPDTIPSTNTALPGRSGSNHDVDHSPYPYSRYPQDEQETYDRGNHPDLASHHSYPSLKRSFSEAEPPAYQEIVQDLRDDGSKMTVNHDHKLLAFKRAQDKHTIVDQQGRIQQLELSAQLHGMFFLSEMPTSTADGNVRQPELTCYRRNLFQISGSLITPRGQLSVITESGETVAVNNMEVTISAIESVDGNPVRLIVIPWKTPPPNSPETNQSPDQEPPALPLIPFQDDGTDADGEYAVYPIGWRRLQFRIATANNGRRKELQQHFVLHLKVVATLANGNKIAMTESTTAPIVVRGRSPRNFQARKEIPLLGSSAGSRGQALVETGLGVVAGALSVKQHEAKVRGLDGQQLPRSAFTFSAPKLPGTQLVSMRSSSYPAWNSPSQVPMSQVPSSGPGNYPATTIGSDPFPKLPLTGASAFTAEPQELPLQTSMEPSVQLSLVSADQTQPPIRPQYTYVHSTTAPPQLPIHTSPLSGHHESALSIPRYVDNPRPSKSPRHVNHPSVRSAGSMTNEASPEYRYGPYAPVNTNPSDVAQPGYTTEPSSGNAAPARDYYPSSNTWTTTAGEPSSSVAYTNNDGRPYPFPHDQYKSTTAGTSPTKTDSSQSQAPSVYSGGPRGSFDAMNQYSWSGN